MMLLRKSRNQTNKPRWMQECRSSVETDA